MNKSKSNGYSKEQVQEKDWYYQQKMEKERIRKEEEDYVASLDPVSKFIYI